MGMMREDGRTSTSDLSYEMLQRYGWAINRGTGIVMAGYASVSLCLTLDGRRLICIPGAGPTSTEALRDAVAAVNAWIRRQPPTHPARRLFPDIY
jgi:hypothetical protein